MTEFSMDWLDTRNWRLPSGQALAEFALQAGFLAPLLLKTEQLRPIVTPSSVKNPERTPAREAQSQPARQESGKTNRSEEVR